MRVRVLTLTFGLIVGTAAMSSAEPSVVGPTSLRAGTIVGGTGLETGGGDPWEDPVFERSGCEYAVDCATWLHSGCNPALAGHDPVLTSSIVDVSNLAGLRTDRTLRMEGAHIPPWGVWPGAVIQLWRADCTEILKLHTIGTDTPCDGPGGGPTQCRLRIPVGTRWMTLSAYVTTVQLSWTLV